MNYSKFKKFITDIYTSGTSGKIDLETTQKIVLLNIFFTIGIPMLMVFGTLAFLRGQVLMGILEHSSLIIVFISFLHMRKVHHYFQAALISTCLIFILFSILFVSGSIENSGHVWSLFLPLFLLFFLGIKWGTILTLGFILLVMVALQMPLDLLPHQHYSLDFLGRYLGAFALIYTTAYFFEYIRKKTSRSIQQKNLELEKTVKELQLIGKTLKESEKRFRELADLLPQPVFEADLQGNITFLSRSGYELSGYSEQDFTHRFDALQMFVPEDRRRLKENTLKIFKHQKLGGIKYRIQKKDGSTFPVIIHSAPIVKEDLIVGSRGIIIDISQLMQAKAEKKKLEEKLTISEKMETVGQLAGGVAHDLNNILSAIVGYPDLLLLNLPKKSKLRKPILTMKKSGQKAAAIVQDLLTLAKRGATGKKVVNLNGIIKDYLSSAEFEKLKSFHPHIEIRTHLESELFNMHGSDIHLTKTIMNLVSNAVESMPSGGTIEISTSNRYLDRAIRGIFDKSIPPGDFVTFKISDQGVGIPRSRIRKIFEPFYTKKILGRSGTGLGMAVVWGTVVDHHGHILIDSSQKKGTTFELLFPPSREELASKKLNAKLKDYRGNGEKILVVDDIKEQREIATLILTRLGYQVFTVSSGEEALEYLDHNQPDLVILDMIMNPGIDGLDTYKGMIKLNPGLRAIIVSGYSETNRVKNTLKMGVGSYVKKPYTMETIGLAVKNQLKKS